MVSLCCALLASCSAGIDLDSELATVDSQLESLPGIQPKTLCRAYFDTPAQDVSI